MEDYYGLSEFINQIFGRMIVYVANGDYDKIPDFVFSSQEQYEILREQHRYDSVVRFPPYLSNFEPPTGYFYCLMGKKITAADFDDFFTRLETIIQTEVKLPIPLTLEEARQEFSEYATWRHLEDQVFKLDVPEFLIPQVPEGSTADGEDAFAQSCPLFI